MKKETATTQMPATEEKLQTILKQHENVNKQLASISSVLLCVMGLFVSMMPYTLEADHPLLQPLSIAWYVLSGFCLLLGLVSMPIVAWAGPYKCQVCGHVHRCYELFPILGFCLFGKKQLHCAYCDQKTLHTKQPRTPKKK